MECLVYRVSMRDPGDASGISGLIDQGTLAASEILAIFGKTEGNGCVNDFTRGYALSAVSAMLAPRLGIAADAVPDRVAMVMSGGTEGGLSPHFLVFAVSAGAALKPAARRSRSARRAPRRCRPRQSAVRRRQWRWPGRSAPPWSAPRSPMRRTSIGSRSNA